MRFEDPGNRGERSDRTVDIRRMTPNGSGHVLPFTVDVSFQPGDIVFATDRLGCVVYWNKEAEAFSGHKTEEVLGKPYTLAYRIEPDGATLNLPAILAGRDFAGAVHCRSRSGGEVVLYLFATAGRNPKGEPAGVVFVGRDVTGLWQAEEVAQASADKYRVLFENSLDSVAIADLDGKVLEANPACLRLYGYTIENVKGVNLTDVVAPEDRSAAADAMASLRAGRLVTKTFRMRRKDGTRFVVDLVASVLTVGGERRIMSVTRDVTERVRAEQARSQSELMYRAVFESANDAVFIESVDGRILDVNRNGCELLGYTRDELVKRNVSDLVPAEARGWLTHVADAILRDKTFRTEAVNVHKNGRHIPVEISASTMELNARTVVLAIVRDITERKRVEAALTESENRYRTLFNDSLTGIYRTTPDGQILLANPTLIRMLGYDSFTRLAERNLEKDDSGPEYKRDEFKQRLERDGRIVGLEVGWQTSDGRTLSVRENAQAVRGPDGAILYYDGTVEDITDRKAAERALRESEEKFRSVAEQSPNMIFINNRGRVVYANQKSVDIMGYERQEFYAPGFDFMKLIAPESVEQIKSVYARHASGGEVEPYEYSLITKDGRRIESIITTKLIEYDGTKAILGIVTDITERRAAERALLESERQYRTALDAMRDPVHVADADLRIVMVNQAFLRWLAGRGIDHAVLGKTVFDAFPFLPAKVREEYRHVFEAGAPLVTNEETTVAGCTYSTETTKVPVTEGDKVVRVLTVVRDTTERRAAELALRESEEKYRSVVERASDGICVVQDGRLKYVNPRLAEMAGYSAAELVDRQFLDYLHPEDRAGVAARYRRRLEGEKQTSTYSVRFLRRDGSSVRVEVNAALSAYEGAAADIVLVRDISERERAEQAVVASEERYRSLVEASPDGIVVYQDGLVVLANRASAELLGYEGAADLVGRRAASLVNPDDLPRVEQRGEMLRTGGAAAGPLRVRFLSRTGDLIPAEVVGASTTWHGKPAIQVMVRPLSTRRS
jgi:PAS domain S-box-containing protein